MSTPRRLPLLVIVFGLVLGACLPGSVRASDPTVGCYAPVGDSTTGVWLPSDAGYYDLMGLQSTASTNYNVLCAWRGLYNYGPNGETQVWGPWHGNNHASTQYCDQAVVTEFQDANDWALAFSGSVGARINNATGKLVIVWFELEGVCSANVICAGVSQHIDTARTPASAHSAVRHSTDVFARPVYVCSDMSGHRELCS